MKKILALLVVFVITLLSIVVCAGAENSPVSNLDALISALMQDEQTQYRFDRWSETDQAEFLQMAKRYGFELDEKDMVTAAAAVLQCFQQAYGENRSFWTVEQKHQYDSFEYQCGWDDSIIHVMPNENEITLEQATQIAMASIRTQADGTRWHGWDETDLERCQWVSASYLADEDLGAHWEIGFFQSNDVATMWGAPETQRIQTFTVFLWDGGQNPQVEFNDLYTMRYMYACAREYHGIPYKLWTLDDKAAIYQQLLSVYEREIQRQGEIPEGIITEILTHVQSVPTETEMQEDTAIAEAKNAAKNAGVDVSSPAEDEIAVYFWRDNPVQPIYHIEFYTESGELLYEVDIQAN